LRARFDKLPPAAIALLLQTVAFLIALLFARATAIQMQPLLFALLCGTLAAALSYIAGLARWWLLIQFLFVPALVLMLALDIPPGFSLAAFLILLVVYWSTFRSQVPLYLSSRKIWRAMELLLPALPHSPAGGGIEAGGASCGQGADCSGRSLTLSRGEREPHFAFMDLGSGIGGVLTHLARVRPDGRYYGVEAAPLPFLLSWLRIRLGGYRNCTVHWSSLWDCDLAQYDVVFAYLSPVPMDELWQKARNEMRPGSVFISNTFSVADHPPQQTFTVDDLHRSTLYIWHM
jgi:hypothetical protein